MKKSLLALAVLGAFTGVASAQSSVTLSGTVDASGKYVKNSGSSKLYSLANSGLNSSQLVFAGTEDLGGGLKAGFELNAGLNNDTGGTNTAFFNRRSVVKLSGGFGEIRLGREYAPSFWNMTIFDPFGTNGVGSSLNPISPNGAVGVARLYTGTRRDNGINYYLPGGIGGIYGQFTAAASENGTTTDRAGRYVGARVGWAGGPVNVAVSYAQQKYNSGALNTKNLNVGGSFDLGVVKLMGYWDNGKQGSLKNNLYSIGAVVPIGQGEIHASYNLDKLKGAATHKIDQFALGYVYNLSKRTALYSTAAILKNKDNGSAAITGFIPGGNGINLGGKSTGAEFGLRHFF